MASTSAISFWQNGRCSYPPIYSHYIIPGVELASWISEGEKAPEGDKLDVPFRALMGIIYVPKEEVDGYCAQAKMLVDKILAEHPQFLEL